MGRTPLIAFRHAIRKAGERIGGAANGKISANELENWGFHPTQAWGSGSKSAASVGKGKETQVTRLSKPVPRATLSESEMEAVMLGGAP